MLTTPILKTIKPFDSTKDYTFEFYYSGNNQATKNQLVIIKTSDNTEVYNQTIDSFQFKHTVSANTLTLNQEYKAKIKVFDINGNYSEFSDYIVFWCFQPAQLNITNIIGGKILNQTFEFHGEYLQEFDELQSYRFYLYNEYNNLIGASTEKFDKLLKHEFTGFDNREIYKIEIKTMSVHGVESSSGLISFMCEFIQPKLASLLTLENMSDHAAISLSAKVIQIIGKIDSGTIQYENDDWIDLKNGEISFEEAFSLGNNFTLKMWCKDLPINEVFLIIYGRNGGTIELSYMDDNRIHVYKKKGTVEYHIATYETVAASQDDVIFIYLQQIDDLMNIKAQLDN